MNLIHYLKITRKLLLISKVLYPVPADQYTFLTTPVDVFNHKTPLNALQDDQEINVFKWIDKTHAHIWNAK